MSASRPSSAALIKLSVSAHGSEHKKVPGHVIVFRQMRNNTLLKLLYATLSTLPIRSDRLNCHYVKGEHEICLFSYPAHPDPMSTCPRQNCPGSTPAGTIPMQACMRTFRCLWLPSLFILVLLQGPVYIRRCHKLQQPAVQVGPAWTLMQVISSSRRKSRYG